MLRLPQKPHCVSGTTSGVMWVDSLLSVEEDPGVDFACYVKKRDSSIVPPSRALVISWCSLLNRLSPPCFHTSAGFPSPPGALPSFTPAITLANSSTF